MPIKKGKTLKLGNRDLEIKLPQGSISALEGRALILDLIADLVPAAILDLTRLTDVYDLPAERLDNAAREFSTISCLVDISQNKIGRRPGTPTPLSNLYKLCASSKTRLGRLKNEVEKECGKSPTGTPSAIARRALNRLAGDWTILSANPKAQDLCRSIEEWAARWNINAEWVLNVAIRCLIEIKASYLDRLDLNKQILQEPWVYEQYDIEFRSRCLEAWRIGCWYLRCDLIGNETLDRLEEVPTLQPFIYKWMHDFEDGRRVAFEVQGRFSPFSRGGGGEEFARKMTREVELALARQISDDPGFLVGHSANLRSNLREFEARLAAYIKQGIKQLKQFGTPPFEKRYGDRHFRWAVEYQVLRKTFDTISIEHNVDASSVSVAVKQVSALIGLSLRKPTSRTTHTVK